MEESGDKLKEQGSEMRPDQSLYDKAKEYAPKAAETLGLTSSSEGEKH